ncbi:MAG: hypothetical protein KDE26_09965 [Bacteroidetes bacterium]|nr:hypothetical protein [Bacteroidota bacterium]
MDFWGKKINVSREAAERQIEIIKSFPPEKRWKIALDFADMGIQRTHDWIKTNHPEFSELEVRLEFVRLFYYEKGEMSLQHWLHFKTEMEKMIRKNWIERFRRMVQAKGWSYEEVAKYGRFKNRKVVEATVSRGLPSFAKLAVVLFEQNQTEN